MIDAVRSNVPTLERVVFLGTESWKDLLDAAVLAHPSALHEREATLQFDDPINIQYTSGTTGNPKGATLTHNNILNNGYFIGEGCRYTAMDRVCIPVPFYHCFGMVLGNLACTTHGATMVVPAPTFDAAMTLRTVQEEHCTSLYGVPTMFIAELALPDFDPVRPLVPPHRNHGRLPLSDCRDEAVRIRDAYGRSDDLLRHD